MAKMLRQKRRLANHGLAELTAAMDRTLRHGGVPDLPPPLLHRLAMVSSLWGFSADDAREYSAALAADDLHALRNLLRQRACCSITKCNKSAPHVVLMSYQCTPYVVKPVYGP